MRTYALRTTYSTHPNGGGKVADSASVHPDAYVDSNAKVGPDSTVGPDVVVGSGCTIEQSSVTGSVTLEADVSLHRSRIQGDDALLAFSTLRDCAITGSPLISHSRLSHATIFGQARLINCSTFGLEAPHAGGPQIGGRATLETVHIEGSPSVGGSATLRQVSLKGAARIGGLATIIGKSDRAIIEIGGHTTVDGTAHLVSSIRLSGYVHLDGTQNDRYNQGLNLTGASLYRPEHIRFVPLDAGNSSESATIWRTRAGIGIHAGYSTFFFTKVEREEVRGIWEEFQRMGIDHIMEVIVQARKSLQEWHAQDGVPGTGVTRPQ